MGLQRASMTSIHPYRHQSLIL